MRVSLFVAAGLAMILPPQHAAAQGTNASEGSDKPIDGAAATQSTEMQGAPAQETAPEPMASNEEIYRQMLEAAAAVERSGRIPADDSAEQARRMARTDRDEARYFNRPGATPTAYEQDWQSCRQIARRLAVPRTAGAWMQAGSTHAGILGGLLFGGFDAAFSQRRARRDIRRICLVARGWRMVEPDEAGRQRIAALPSAEREAYFNSMLSAEQAEPGAIVMDQAALVASGARAKLADQRDED